jgi:hypothetical protein
MAKKEKESNVGKLKYSAHISKASRIPRKTP